MSGRFDGSEQSQNTHSSKTGEWGTRELRRLGEAVGLLPRVGVGAGAQRTVRLVGTDDDARAHSLRADEREFAWRSSIREETFAFA